VASNGLGLLGHIWRVSDQDVVDIVAQVDTPEAQGLYISCTNLPTYDVIEPLEQALGKPVPPTRSPCGRLCARWGWTARVRVSGCSRWAASRLRECRCKPGREVVNSPQIL
jgi:hypothetical protein